MKKKLISLLLCTILVVATLTGLTPLAAGSRYVAFGDSISAGYGLSDVSESFPALIAKDKGYTLTNLATSGYTVGNILTQLESRVADDAIIDANLITITCGGNDIVGVLCKKVAEAYNASHEPKISEDDVLTILSNPADSRRMTLALQAVTVLTGNSSQPAFSDCPELATALENYEKGLISVISYIKNLNPKARIIVATQYNPYNNFQGLFTLLDTQCDKSVKKLNKIITENATVLGYEIADVYTHFEGSSVHLCNSDEETMNLDFHPNSQGHKEMAECIGAMLPDTDIFSVFTDVKPGDWFYDATRYVYENKLFMGVSETQFAPTSPLTRGMFVTVLYRYDGTPDISGESTFQDVQSGAYYHDAVVWATSNKIVSGYSEETFAPDDYITREQISTILLRYAQAKGKGPVGAWAIHLDYSDISDISDYAGNGVMYCTMKGIMQGKDGNRFAPKDNTTRAEAAVIMKKLAEVF